jgi:hypothetical protein
LNRSCKPRPGRRSNQSYHRCRGHRCPCTSTSSFTLPPPQFAIRQDSYVETMRRDGTLHEFNAAYKSRRASASSPTDSGASRIRASRHDRGQSSTATRPSSMRLSHRMSVVSPMATIPQLLNQFLNGRDPI